MYAGQFVRKQLRISKDQDFVTIQGKVIHNGKPVPGTLVLASKLHDEIGSIEDGMTSTAQGSFKLKVPAHGHFKLLAFNKGYHPARVGNLVLKPGSNLQMLVCMKKDPDQRIMLLSDPPGSEKSQTRR